MARGDVYPPETKFTLDNQTGARIRQLTNHSSIHHHPFFFVPAYDDAMQHLVFVSHRTGRPEIFMERRVTGELIQLTEQEEIEEYSVYPSHDGRYVYFTAGTKAYRVYTEAYKQEELVAVASPFGGTTALSSDDQWWAVSFPQGEQWCLTVINTTTGAHEVILTRDAIAHLMFCPDDPSLLFYAGPLNDRVWAIRRDGTANRRLYQRQPGEWITHETWLPGSRELAFVDWPHGIRCVHVDTGKLRHVTSFNAWHASCNRDGTWMVADTNFPDIGLQLFNPQDGVGEPRTLCFPRASNRGEHWKGAFPYEHGPIPTYAPQHTHPHPSFSPDGRYIVFTSDCTGFSQVYELELSAQFLERK